MSYYPTIDEFLSLLCFATGLILIGKVIKNFLIQKKELSKFSIVVFVWLSVIVSYSLFSGYLYLKADVSHRLVTLGWCLFFWFIPMFYYSFFFVNVVSSQIVEHLSPIGDRIEDPSPFAKARKLAILGDIDGAIALYRTYKEHQVEALFEAFRLLKSRGRFDEALQTLQEIIDNHSDRVDAWVEAKYYQAKIMSTILKKYDEAIKLYKQILRKRTKTPFHTLASTEIARLQAIGKNDSLTQEKIGKITETQSQEENTKTGQHTGLYSSKEEKKRYILAIEDTLLGDYTPPDPFFKGDAKKILKELKEEPKGLENKNENKETCRKSKKRKTEKTKIPTKSEVKTKVKKRTQRKKEMT